MRAQFFDSLTLKSDKHLICSQHIICTECKSLENKGNSHHTGVDFSGKSPSPYYKNSSENGKENM